MRKSTIMQHLAVACLVVLAAGCDASYKSKHDGAKPVPSPIAADTLPAVAKRTARLVAVVTNPTARTLELPAGVEMAKYAVGSKHVFNADYQPPTDPSITVSPQFFHCEVVAVVDRSLSLTCDEDNGNDGDITVIVP